MCKRNVFCFCSLCVYMRPLDNDKRFQIDAFDNHFPVYIAIVRTKSSRRYSSSSIQVTHSHRTDGYIVCSIHFADTGTHSRLHLLLSKSIPSRCVSVKLHALKRWKLLRLTRWPINCIHQIHTHAAVHYISIQHELEHINLCAAIDNWVLCVSERGECELLFTSFGTCAFGARIFPIFVSFPKWTTIKLKAFTHRSSIRNVKWNEMKPNEWRWLKALDTSPSACTPPLAPRRWSKMDCHKNEM